MKDCRGLELKVGDEVVYVRGKNSDGSIGTGRVTKIYKGHYNEECSVNNHAHILSHRVMKLERGYLDRMEMPQN